MTCYEKVKRVIAFTERCIADDLGNNKTTAEVLKLGAEMKRVLAIAETKHSHLLQAR